MCLMITGPGRTRETLQLVVRLTNLTLQQIPPPTSPPPKQEYLPHKYTVKHFLYGNRGCFCSKCIFFGPGRITNLYSGPGQRIIMSTIVVANFPHGNFLKLVI